MQIGLWATIFGAVLLAFLRIMERKLLALRSEEKKVDDSVLVILGSTGAILFGLIIWIIKDGGSTDFGREFWNAVLITGFMNIFIQIFNLKALGDKKTDMTLSVPVMDTTPALIIILSMVILGQHPTLWGYRGIAILGVSAYVLNITNHVNKSLDGKWYPTVFLAPWKAFFKHRGMRFAVCAALCGSFSINYDGMAAMSGPFIGMSIVMLPSLIVNLIRAIKSKAIMQFRDAERMNFFLWIAYPVGRGVVLSLFWYSLAEVIVPYQATLKRAETLFVFIFAYWLLYERKNALVRLIATVGIIIGASLISLSF